MEIVVHSKLKFTENIHYTIPQCLPTSCRKLRQLQLPTVMGHFHLPSTALMPKMFVKISLLSPLASENIMISTACLIGHVFFSPYMFSHLNGGINVIFLQQTLPGFLEWVLSMFVDRCGCTSHHTYNTRAPHPNIWWSLNRTKAACTMATTFT